jgi:AcrR family transcriptional regulator
MAAREPKGGKAARQPERRRLTAEVRRESLIQIARHAFAARGYEGVRTQDIAAVSGVSEALLYRHFASKRDLYLEVMRLSAEALQATVAGAAQAAPEGRQLDEALGAFVEFVADRSSGWSMVVAQVADPEIAAEQQVLRGRCLGVLVDVLAAEAGVSRSAADRRRVEQLAEVIAGGAESLAVWWSNNPKVSRKEGEAMLVSFARETIASAFRR